jgi:hypothetical protein
MTTAEDITGWVSLGRTRLSRMNATAGAMRRMPKRMSRVLSYEFVFKPWRNPSSEFGLRV